MTTTSDHNTLKEAPAPPTGVLDVSVVIVNYNVKDFLLQCLRSLQDALGGLRAEILVIDNNSSDGSIEFLRPLFPDVNFIELSDNLGFGRANNIGIEMAQGEFILLLNPDTIVSEDTVHRMIEFMNSHPDTGVSGCKVLNPDGTFQLACRRGFPTPWASFCKIFGLQSLFPKSRLFAQYNQTFRNENETYEVDALIGAFMFCRASVLKDLDGFDPQFFMYGEDLDLCYRFKKSGWKVYYAPVTTIIHFKGESTKRSSINEIKIFYQAMEIFARKHFSSSLFFLTFLRLGIYLRSILAYVSRYSRPLFLIFSDILFANLSLMLATKFRFGSALGFPDYAYPTVFLAVTLVVGLSGLLIGEYFESRPSFQKAMLGYMISFFVLSSLTYFFKDFGFSRGVILMTVGLLILLSGLTWLLINVYDKIVGRDADRRIIVVGLTNEAQSLINALQRADTRNAQVVGAVSVRDTGQEEFAGKPVLGNISYLSKIIEQEKIHEVIVSDASLSHQDVVQMANGVASRDVRFHVAKEYEEVVVSRILNDVAGIEPSVPVYEIQRFRNRVIKRSFDIVVSFFLLTVGLPLVYLFAGSKTVKKLPAVFSGAMSLVGIYPFTSEKFFGAKPGLTGLVHISNPSSLSASAIRHLNEYYARHYSLGLDIEVLLKHIFRKKRGS